MSDVAYSTIAQAIYATSHECNFARVVTDLEAVLSRLRNQSLRTRWDYEDVVIFDVGETRIVLGWSEDRTNDQPVCLLIAVGPLPSARATVTDPAHEHLCGRLVERIQLRYPPEAVLWRQLPLAIEADLVDALIECLPPLSEALGTPAAQPPQTAAEPAHPPAAVASGQDPANDLPDLPRLDNHRLANVRAALYPQAEAEPGESTQMRIAAQAMNATLIIVWAPLGAAVMTYSLLKGEKIGFTARVMAVAGTLIGLLQTPLAQNVVAFAGA